MYGLKQQRRLARECCEGSALSASGWVEEHKAATPGNNALQKQLDSWTDAFEAADAARQEAVSKAAAEDGWTLVTRTRVRAAAEDPFSLGICRRPADGLKAC